MRLSKLVLGSAGLILFLVTRAFGADQNATGPSEFIFLVQVVVLVLVGRGLGELMQRAGQPSVMGQLIAGILLGPSVFGSLWPDAQHAIFSTSREQKAMIDGIGQFGVLLLLLLTGMETDLKLVRKVGFSAATVSITGICVPFACGFVLGQFLPSELLPHPEQRLIASLFLGTALSVSSVKIVAMVVREMNFMRRNVGQLIVASAVIDDTIGWVIIAIIFSLATHGALDTASLTRSIFGTAAFLAISFTIGRRLVFRLIRWANDNLMSEVPVVTVIILLMGGMALTTHLIGVHTVLGAFVAGILVGESPILTRHIDNQFRGMIMSLFMPVFFALAGLSTDLTILGDPRLLLLTAGLILIASIGKFAGAFVGGEMSGLTRQESLALACGMNARGSTEVIVATIGLSMGVLSQTLFTMIVAMAIITTLAMPPMLRRALARLPLRQEEKVRLEREEFEERGFVANLERLLLAVDESANGIFASRLAGIIAGARGIPMTVLHVGQDARHQDRKRAEEEGPEAAVKAAAKTTAAVEARSEDQKPGEVEVTTRVNEKAARDAVAQEARKGFDLLMIGVHKTAKQEGGFHEDVTRLAAGFDGPLAVVAARAQHLQRPVDSSLKILAPITGTGASRRGAEIAVALARANNVPVTALFVSIAGDKGGYGATRLHEEATLKDVVALAERYDVKVRTVVRSHVAPDEAILREARAGRYDLIVMGVNRRPGDVLLFGNVAASILQKSKASILFVSS